MNNSNLASELTTVAKLLYLKSSVTSYLPLTPAPSTFSSSSTSAPPSTPLTTLFSHLQSCIGIMGSARSWFRSYLSDRFRCISINNCKTHSTQVTHGVLQGSVFGSLLFILYILPLGHVICHHGLQFHCYADDTQFYISTKSITPAILSTVTNCLTDVKSLMNRYFFKPNCNKSEIIIISPKSLLPSSQDFSHSTDDHKCSPFTISNCFPQK